MKLERRLSDNILNKWYAFDCTDLTVNIIAMRCQCSSSNARRTLENGGVISDGMYDYRKETDKCLSA